MNRAFQIAGRTMKSNVNFKTILYLLFTLLVGCVIFYLRISVRLNLSDLRSLGAFYSTIFLSIGLIWFVGIPAFLYFSYLLANSISEDINSGIALLVFTRPITRKEFLFGRFLGLFLFFGILNGLVLFSFPAIANVFLGVSATFVSELFKVSAGLFVYSLLISLAFAAFGVLLSTRIRKSLLSLAILFVAVLLIFALPLLLSLAGKPNAVPVVKPFYSVVQPFGISIYPPAQGVKFTYSYVSSGSIIIENFSSWIYVIIFSTITPLVFLILAMLSLSRQDIT